MSLVFPASPAVGQRVTQAGRTWEWDGYGWLMVPPITANDTLATFTGLTPTDGDTLVFDSTTSKWTATKAPDELLLDGGNF